MQRVWTAAVDDKKAVVLRLGLGLSVAGNRVYAAGHRGDVVAIDITSGRTSRGVRAPGRRCPAARPSARLVVVGSSDGQLFALDPADGAIRWKVRLNGEVLAPAAISERLIAVRTVDGKLHALSPADGHELWTQEQQVPRLSLRGTARPVIAGDLVLCGFDNGKVVAVNMNDGSVQWEATITPPHGRTELERLADIDSAVSVSRQDVYTVGFQGRVAMLALDTGQMWWSHDASSYRGLTLDDDALYMSTADGEVVALTRAHRSGDLAAESAAASWPVRARGHGRGVVAADFQGYVHWLDKASGALAARVATGKARISTAPVVAGDMVLVINDRGQISAFRVRPLAASARKSPAGGASSAREQSK